VPLKYQQDKGNESGKAVRKSFPFTFICLKNDELASIINKYPKKVKDNERSKKKHNKQNSQTDSYNWKQAGLGSQLRMAQWKRTDGH